MTYGIGIGFPVEPTEKDIKKIKRDLAYDKFGVADGGEAKSKPAGADKTEPAGKRIEVHSGHQKLVVRDLKTGRYVNKH